MELAVVGGGPAGLRAAEIAAQAGAQVTVLDAKASVGRKFLVAGRGGLNLTKDEPVEEFVAHYDWPEEWHHLIADFGPAQLREWAAGLGIETFAASTGRVYPREMKAAPLLRRWVRRLKESGVQFAMHHRWTGLRDSLALDFETPAGSRTITPDAVVLALGGGSWPQTGSDGAWTSILERLGVAVAPLEPANCGWEVAWPGGMHLAEGQPLKNISVRANGREAKGELMITHYGLEGGAIYSLAPALREMAAPMIEIDLKPALSHERLVAKMGPARRNLLAEARQRWKLPEAAVTLLSQHPERERWTTPEALATAIKCCGIPLLRPRPIEEAISSAGGVLWAELDEHLMLRKLPGVFVAGEMIDWEAPTGGYLMQGCFATATRAARGAISWVK